MSKTGWPHITIGLCVKDNVATVGETVESIARTDYPRHRMEVIVVDGMSRDGTADRVKEGLKDSDLHWMLLQDGGKGLAHAQQIVVDRARGEYVIWIDGDNSIPPQFIRKHAAFVKQNPSIGASGSRITSVGDSIVARLGRYQRMTTGYRRFWRENQVALVPMQGSICKLEAMKSIGGFDLEIKGSGLDVDLFVRMYLKGWRFGRSPDAEIFHYVRSTWRSLLEQHIWYGYGRHFLSHKHRRAIRPLGGRRAQPFLLDIIKVTVSSARRFRDIACVLMPLHYFIRQVGFFVGFIMAHRAGYGHQFD